MAGDDSESNDDLFLMTSENEMGRWRVRGKTAGAGDTKQVVEGENKESE